MTSYLEQPHEFDMAVRGAHEHPSREARPLQVERLRRIGIVKLLLSCLVVLQLAWAGSSFAVTCTEKRAALEVTAAAKRAAFDAEFARCIAGTHGDKSLEIYCGHMPTPYHVNSDGTQAWIELNYCQPVYQGGACAIYKTDVTVCEANDPKAQRDWMQSLKSSDTQCRSGDASAVVARGDAHANPILAASGEKAQLEPDVLAENLPHALDLTRVFLSRRALGVTGLGDGLARLGQSWTHNHAVVLMATNTDAQIVFGNGDLVPFVWRAASLSWQAASGSDTLTQTAGIWSFKSVADDSVWKFSAAGALQSVAERNGWTRTYGYDTAGRLARITNQFGRAMGLAYDASGRLSVVTAPDGQTVNYTYDSSNRLSTARYADGQSKTYHYENGTYPNALTGVSVNGVRFATYAYDTMGRGISTEHAGGVEKYQIKYGEEIGAPVVVTDPLLTARTYSYGTSLGRVSVGSASLPDEWGGVSTASSTQDAFGLTTSETDFLGIRTTTSWDTSRRLPLTTTQAAGTPVQQSTSIQWHPSMKLPVLVTEPGRTTALTYDASGNPLTQVVTDAVSKVSRTWQWTYNAQKLVASEKAPNGALTQYAYDSAGRIRAVTNALGQKTGVLYDDAGRLVQTSAPNGRLTAYTYDARGRVLTQATGAEITRFAWAAAGLAQVTSPSGAVVSYSYDAAQRLTQVSDALGNKVVFTLDAMGNRVREDVSGPGGNAVRSLARRFNSLNREQSAIGATTPAAQTTSYTYDASGNVIAEAAPLARNTAQSFDELNRVKAITDAAGGTTQLQYDAQSNLTRVTDAKNQATSYTYDGFGNLLTQTLPDTGVTTFAYNAAGQLSSKKDARGVVASYAYDLLGRVSSVKYPDETVIYTWDVCTNGVGQICLVTDSTGTTSYTYTPRGRLASKMQVSSAAMQTISYAYNSAGQVASMKLPSGKLVEYGYANGQISRITLGGAAVIKDVTYEPLGGVSGWSWGNDSASAPNRFKRSFDMDGRVTRVEAGAAVQPLALAYDAADRITALQKLNGAAVDSSRSMSLVYDRLDRITETTSGAGSTAATQKYSYDQVGNRTSQTTGAQAGSVIGSYSYASGSNRLVSISGPTPRFISYDAAGNKVRDGEQSWTYGGSNRPTRIDVTGANAATITVGINALGQRTSKTVNGVMTRFMYDEAGHLVGEYNASGGVLKEYLWFNDTPVALWSNPAKAINGDLSPVYYVHTDQIGTPRAITKASGNALVWKMDNEEVFGNNAFNDDPAKTGTPFTFNLRFAGQYFDKETGTSQNFWRDYDRTTGRYVQSDPIGIEGGVNTYGYVGGNPAGYVDPEGLQVGRLLRGLGGMPMSPGLDRSSPRPVDPMEPQGPTYSPGVSLPGLMSGGHIGMIGETCKMAVKSLSDLIFSSGSDESSKSRNKPPGALGSAEGRPHSIIEQPGSDGQYTTHNGDGTSKQYRGSGGSHGGIPRPNVKDFGVNTAPDGSQFSDKGRVRPALPGEIPRP